MEREMIKEIQRQVIHFLLGVIALLVLYYYGRAALVAACFAILVAGFVLVNQALLGRRIPGIQWLLERFERRSAKFPGWGSANYALGVLAMAAFLQSQPEIAASLVVIAFGDSLSTIVGRIGTHRLPWNPKKSFEGSATFFIASLPAYHFVGFLILPVALIAAISESIEFPFDDNLIVPIACVFTFLVL